MTKFICLEVVVTEPICAKAMTTFLCSVNLALKKFVKFFRFWQSRKLCFELVYQQGRISWLILCPQSMRQFLLEQLRAYFADCAVSEIDCGERKNWFKKLRYWRTIDFGQVVEADLYKDPVKTAENFDPLIGVINALKVDGTVALYRVRLKNADNKGLFRMQIKVAMCNKARHSHFLSALQGAVGEKWNLKWRGRVLRFELPRFFSRDPLIDVNGLLKFFHFPLVRMMVPGLWQSKMRETPLMIGVPNTIKPEGTKLGLAKNINGWQDAYLPDKERRKHVYIVGKTGMGKSTLIANMALSDIDRGEGVCVIDPHGDLVETVMAALPKSRLNDVIYFNPVDKDFPVGFNILARENSDLQLVIASNLVEVLKRLFAHSWGPRLEYILRNTVLSLIALGDSNLLMINRLLVDGTYRKNAITRLQDPLLKQFWLQEFEKMPAIKKVEAIAPIQNKVGQFLSNPLLRNILGQMRSSFNFEWIVNNKKIFLANLSKGLLGEDNAILLGSVLVNKFQIAAMSRAYMSEPLRNNYYLFVDEFQNFVTDSFATILAEARKYGLCLTLANQYLSQLPETIKNALFGNVGTTISFQTGIEDANILLKTFGENFSAENVFNLRPYDALVKMNFAEMGNQVFSLKTLPLSAGKGNVFVEKIKRISRERYGRRRDVVEQDIAKLLAYAG